MNSIKWEDMSKDLEIASEEMQRATNELQMAMRLGIATEGRWGCAPAREAIARATRRFEEAAGEMLEQQSDLIKELA